MQYFLKPIGLKQKVYSSFLIHCGGVHRQKYKNCVTVHTPMDPTVCIGIYSYGVKEN